jgi:hypothetical protein
MAEFYGVRCEREERKDGMGSERWPKYLRLRVVRQASEAG